MYVLMVVFMLWSPFGGYERHASLIYPQTMTLAQCQAHMRFVHVKGARCVQVIKPTVKKPVTKPNKKKVEEKPEVKKPVESVAPPAEESKTNHEKSDNKCLTDACKKPFEEQPKQDDLTPQE